MSLELTDTNELNTEFFDEVLAIEDKIQYVKDTIIPQMDERKGRTSPMSSEEINEKLFGKPNQEKTPEFEELKAELDKLPDEPMYNADLLLEISDIAYYFLQPNYKAAKIDSHLLSPVRDTSNAALFCIVKYGDEENYKEIEHNTMVSFLEYLKARDDFKWLRE